MSPSWSSSLSDFGRGPCAAGSVAAAQSGTWSGSVSEFTRNHCSIDDRCATESPTEPLLSPGSRWKGKDKSRHTRVALSALQAQQSVGSAPEKITTIMIRNLPRHLKQHELIKELELCGLTYDFATCLGTSPRASARATLS